MNRILIKQSAVVGHQPATSDLQTGELAINTADLKLFCLSADGSSAFEIAGVGYSLDANAVHISGTETITGAKTFSAATLLVTGTISSPGVGLASEHFGAGSTAAGESTVSVGYGAVASMGRAVALGTTALATGWAAIAVGGATKASNTSSIAIGGSANVGAQAAIAIGDNTVIPADAGGTIALGFSNSINAGSTYCITIGYQATISGTGVTRAIAIGQGANCLFSYSIALGSQANTTAANQMVVGAPSTAPINECVFVSLIGFTMTFQANATSSPGPRNQARISSAWVTNQDATRKGRLMLSACDFNSTLLEDAQGESKPGSDQTAIRAALDREGLRIESDGTQPLVGFYGGAAVAKASVTGNVATGSGIASLVTVLASMGMITNSTLVVPASPISSPGAGLESEQFGAGSAAAGQTALSVGFNAVASNTLTTALGGTASATGQYAIAIGFNAQASGTSSVSIGVNTNNGAVNSVAVGANTVLPSDAIGTVTLGYYNRINAGSTYCTVLGFQASIYGTGTTGAIAIGRSAHCDFSNSIALGATAATTAINQMVVGAASTPINECVFVTALGGMVTFQAPAVSGPGPRNQARISSAWATNQDATRTGRLVLSACDYQGALREEGDLKPGPDQKAIRAALDREGLRIESDGAQPLIGFFGQAAVAKQVLSGSVTVGGADSTIAAALAALGLAINSTTPVTQATLNGTTSGDVSWSMPVQSNVYKKFVVLANAYVNSTTTNQTITYPVAFTRIPVVIGNNTGLTITTTATDLTITAPGNATAFEGTIIIEGA